MLINEAAIILQLSITVSDELNTSSKQTMRIVNKPIRFIFSEQVDIMILYRNIYMYHDYKPT